MIKLKSVDLTLPSGRLCIEVAPTSKIAFISETLCIGCGIVRDCVSLC